MERTPAEGAAADAAAGRDQRLSRAHKKAGGVVHTPPELARFVARAADTLLRERLGLAHGLADRGLSVIDPACGPGAFLAAAAAVARGRAPASESACVLYGFDRDPAAIESAHAALDTALARDGFALALRCRDTLHDVLPAEVAALAPALCVLGNPPWVGSAQEAPSPWMAALLEDFRRDELGVRLPERKLGVLSDAYVRFMRWACAVAERAQRGAVVALVTNASYLDGPVHRGMRAVLLRAFDSVHVIDLGGSALLARGAQRDENVFGVRPSVAIAICVRGQARAEAGRGDAAPAAEVHYARIAGSRAEKLARLGSATLAELAFERVTPRAPYQRFVPTHAAHEAYAGWPSLAEAMPFQREGVQTNRDRVVVDTDRVRLLERLRAFAAGSARDDLGAALRGLPHYDPERARVALRSALAQDASGEGAALVRRLAYRPFDTRWFAAIAPLCHRPRPDLLRAIDRGGPDRVALISTRKDRGALSWMHVAATRDAPDNCFLSARSSCRTRAFPELDDQGRDNLSPAVAAAFAERVGRAIDASAFIRYALAVLSSAAYRARYDEQLRIDYPRIPPPRDARQFDAWHAHGERLLRVWCDPLPHRTHAGPAEPLALDRERGELRRGARVVCSVSAAALDLRVGHHLPLRDLARSAALSAGDDAALSALCARIEALNEAIEGLPDDGW